MREDSGLHFGGCLHPNVKQPGSSLSAEHVENCQHLLHIPSPQDSQATTCHRENGKQRIRDELTTLGGHMHGIEHDVQLHPAGR